MNAFKTYARFAKFYDLYTTEYTEDIPFYLAAVTGRRPPFLEIGCGTGRVLLSLRQAGYVVTGIDISEEMLALARAKLGPVDDRGSLFLHDFAKGILPGQYQVALITFYTFNYIHPNNRLTFLKNLAKSLADDALIVLHLFYPEALTHPELAGTWQAKGCYQVGGREIKLYDCRRMLDDQTEERRQRYESSDGVSEEIHTERYYLQPSLMINLLKEAGFGRARITRDMRWEHLALLDERETASGEYMLVAEKLSS